MSTNKLCRILGTSLAGAAVLTFAVGAHAQAPTLFDHYLCYKGAVISKTEKLPTNPAPARTLIDQFENRIYDAKDPIWHCNPAEKIYKGQDSPINFPNIHIEGYPIKLTKTVPQAKDVTETVTTVDQFGLLRLKVLKPESLDVRTSKTLIASGQAPPAPKYTACSPTNPCATGVCFPGPTGFCVSTAAFPPPPANDGSVDNFKCYSVALNGQKFTKITGQVTLTDEFQTSVPVDIIKPTRICTPVDKNSENPDAPTHPGHLVCYQIKSTNKYLGNKVADSNGNFTSNHFDVKTVNELCVPATKAVCGNGVVDAPYEECDSPKICSGGVNNGLPCTKATDCPAPGKCVPNTLQCPGGVACAANCTCPLPPPAVALNTPCPVYHEAGSFLDECQNIFASGCAAPARAPALPLASGGTTFNLCTSAADVNGMRALTVDPTTWFSDALFNGPPAAFFPVTFRLCPVSPMTGVLFTKATANTFPAKFCVIGDPAKLRMPCANNSDCDLAPGSGVCAARDVDYTSATDPTGTAFTFGDGTPDPAGSALFAQDLRQDVWLGGDVRCVGTGSAPTCVGCDNVTPAPAGRIGIDAAAGPPLFSVPQTTRFTTGNAENIIVSGSQAGVLDGREVSGSGTPGLSDSLVVVGGNAKLQINAGVIGPMDAQFFDKQVFAPVVP